MIEEDARRLYVDVSGALQARARSRSALTAGRRHSFGAQRAEFPLRTLAEAEGESRPVPSGYRTVVAFEGRGEAERARST